MFNVAQHLQVQIHLGDGDVGFGMGRSKDYKYHLPILFFAPRDGGSVDIDKSKTVIVSFEHKGLVDELIDILHTIRAQLPDDES